MQHHVAIVEQRRPFEIQHFFVYVFRGYPELERDFRLFFEVRVAGTRPLSARFLTMRPSLMRLHSSLHLAAKTTYICTSAAYSCKVPPSCTAGGKI